MRTIEVNLYQFEELSPAAKERAREWWREREGQTFGQDVNYEPYETAAKILGLTFATDKVQTLGGHTREHSKIYWSGFFSQGDGASFVGRWEYKAGCSKAIRKEFGKDEKLWAIADSLTEFGKKHGYKTEGKVIQGNRSGSYVHEYTMDAEVYDKDGNVMSTETEKEFIEIMRNFARWIYRSLEEEYEYRMSDESVDESITANEYEFTEDGHCA